MATRFVPIDRDTPLLLPPDLRDWVPVDHLVHFVLDAVEALDLRQVKVNTRGTGSEQYPPHMLLGLLIYSYATGTFGSREIDGVIDGVKPYIFDSRLTFRLVGLNPWACRARCESNIVARCIT